MFTKRVAKKLLENCKEKKKASVYKEPGYPSSGPTFWKPEGCAHKYSRWCHPGPLEVPLLGLDRGSGSFYSCSGTCEIVQTEVTQ